MRRTIEGIGRRSVRKPVSITPQLEMILNELSNATGNKFSSSEIMSIFLHHVLHRDDWIRWFESKYVDPEENRLRILYRQEGEEKKRMIRSERMG